MYLKTDARADADDETILERIIVRLQQETEGVSYALWIPHRYSQTGTVSRLRPGEIMIHAANSSLRAYIVIAMLILAGVNLWAVNEPSYPSQKLSQLKAKAERGSVQQELQLANAYLLGDEVPRDAAQAAFWYERAAEAGQPAAQNQIGYFYQAGIGVPVNLPRAAHWFQLAAASGSVIGTMNLGVAYLGGLGVPKNEATAQQLFAEAFHKGSGTAASYMGDMYFFGVGMQANRVTAESWYKAGTKLHDPSAAFKLGTLYSVTEGHVQDLRKAVRLLRLSAEGGYVPAMHSLGVLLINHPEFTKSAHEAPPWVEKAANAGSWKSSMVLGVLARDGKEVPADREAAYYYFQVAAREGGTEAQQLLAYDLKMLEAKLGSGAQERLKSAADAWAAQHSLALLYIDKNIIAHSHNPAFAIAVAPPGAFVGQLVPNTSGLDLKLSRNFVP